MMGHQHLERVFRSRMEVRPKLFDLLTRDPAILPSVRPCRVHPGDGHLVVMKLRIHLVRDETPIVGQRPTESGSHVVQRYVVISWHNDSRQLDSIEKLTS